MSKELSLKIMMNACTNFTTFDYTDYTYNINYLVGS